MLAESRRSTEGNNSGFLASLHMDLSGLYCHRVPVFLAVLVCLINDHFLKKYGGVLVGKLSDVAGLFFFPFLVWDVLLLGARSFFRKRRLGRALGLFALICLTSGLLFSTIKGTSQGLHQFNFIYSLVVGVPSSLITDVTDLWALFSLPIAFFYFWRTREAEY